MAKTSTLIYLVDDYEIPSDMLLFPEYETTLKDEYLLSILDLLETDPGDELVSKIMERIEE